jgi:hypothetical protein
MLYRARTVRDHVYILHSEMYIVSIYIEIKIEASFNLTKVRTDDKQQTCLLIIENATRRAIVTTRDT